MEENLLDIVYLVKSDDAVAKKLWKIALNAMTNHAKD